MVGVSSRSNRHLAILGTLNRTAGLRRVPLSIEAHTVQWTEVTHLAIFGVYNSITTAGYPSRISSISRCVRGLKNASICPGATADAAIRTRRAVACDRLRTQVLGVAGTWVPDTVCPPAASVCHQDCRTEDHRNAHHQATDKVPVRSYSARCSTPVLEDTIRRSLIPAPQLPVGRPCYRGQGNRTD